MKPYKHLGKRIENDATGMVGRIVEAATENTWWSPNFRR